MKKVVVVLLVIFSSCKQSRYNAIFEKIGVFSDKVKILTVQNSNQSVVFIPMHHVGTRLFYDNVRKKIDSLRNQGYYFFYEKLKSNATSIPDTVTLLKIRKIIGVPLSKDAKTDHLSFFKNTVKVKFKKEIISQPQIDFFEPDKNNALNVDCYLVDLITEYEKKYGKLELSACDLQSHYFELSKCPIDIDRVNRNKTIYLDYRNNIVVQEVLKNEHQKIAIIYGENHFVGIKAALIEKGYQEVKPAVKPTN